MNISLIAKPITMWGGGQRVSETRDKNNPVGCQLEDFRALQILANLSHQTLGYATVHSGTPLAVR